MIRNGLGQIVLSPEDEHRLNELIVWSRQFTREREVYHSLDATRFVRDWHEMREQRRGANAV